jgi:Flp pilus assembly pilin Flp
MKTKGIISLFRRLRRDEDGVAFVEFAILLPMMLLIFAVIIEGGRLFWSYQATILGVRDAARYLARVAPTDICFSGGSVAGYQGKLVNIVQNASNGNAIFPSGVTVNSVTPSFACVAGNYRGGQAAVATVTANLTVTFPFATIFTFAGGNLGTVTTTVTDQNRIYGT